MVEAVLLRQELEQRGFALATGVVSAVGRQHLLDALHLDDGASRPAPRLQARRALLWKHPMLGEALASSGLVDLASAILGRRALPVDALFFDKTEAANWAVPAHQDRMLPVADGAPGQVRHRDGIAYADIPRETLEQLVALRVHFDDTDAGTGALCVLPGSHADGIKSDAHLRQLSLVEFVPCPAAAGDVLLLRPLLLHRSSPMVGVGRRRVLHVVFTGAEPRGDVHWRSLQAAPA